MKTTIFIFLLSSCFYAIGAQETIAGLWQTGNDNTIIEIVKNDTQWLGKISSSDNEKAVIGKVIIKEFEPKDNGFKAKMYVAKKDKWMDAFFEIKEEELQVKISAGWKKKKIKWKRSGVN